MAQLMVAAALAVLTTATAAPTTPATTPPGIENADCMVCHGDKDLVKKTKDGKKISMFVDETKFAGSIHGKILCSACHNDIKELPHEDQPPKPVSCAQCHRIETDIYLKSDHGRALSKGVTEAATCQNCHGKPHELLNYRNPASPVHRHNIPATCAQCHADIAAMEKYQLRQRAVVITYEKTVHGRAHERGVSNSAVCTDCHGSHDLHHGANPSSKLYWRNLPTTCGKCHENVKQTYNRSIHGKAVASGNRDAPSCVDCHGEHTIIGISDPLASVASGHIPETCGRCHASERIATRYRLSPMVVQTYMKSFHGLSLAFGGVTAAHCASCHGVHDILPSDDPLSAIHPVNLPQTCGKCHPGMISRLKVAPIRIHAPPGAAEGKHWLVNFVARFYIAMIIVVVGLMALHNALDWLAKTRAHIRRHQQNPNNETRFSRWGRFQHFSMIVLFAILAYTGFVHKYPEAWWSLPFHVLPDGGYWRGFIHRFAGWVFTILIAVHLIALLLTAKGRVYLRDLWPRWHDVGDAWHLISNRLRLRPDPLPHRRFNYIEKAEYWALVWGSLVMIVTGVMLIYNEAMLQLMPKVVYDIAAVVHLYEAVLATLAIVVWHLYAVIFDPREYPMNPAWLTGRKPLPDTTHPVDPPAPRDPSSREEPAHDAAP